MLLVVTNKSDLACDFLILRLKERKVSFIRLNTEDYGKQYEIDLTVSQHESALTVTFSDRLRVSADQIAAVYFRQPHLPELSPEIASQDREFAIREIREQFRSLWRLIDEQKWINHPRRLWLASNKIEQLSVAARIGFTIPDTLVTRSLPKLRQFFDSHQGRIICKAVKNGFIYDQNGATVALTQRIGEDYFTYASDFAPIPSIYQPEIRKVYDIRVIVVRHNVYSTAIHSQEHAETEVDWRAWDLCDFSLRHEPIELPNHIVNFCRNITAHYSLSYSAIDLVLGQDGNYYFLELNPNGQWAWIEYKTGYPIRDAIIDNLGYADA